MFLPARINATYALRACNGNGCDDSAAVSVSGRLTEAVGYVKPSTTVEGAAFGWSVAIAADGRTLSVGAPYSDNGTVYVYTRNGGTWVQQAIVEASNPGFEDRFGYSVALAADGGTLAVGADAEDSGATGIDGDQADESALNSGAVYVYTRQGSVWRQQAYIKSSNSESGDLFGTSVALAADGNTLAVSALGEASDATGVNGDQSDNSAPLAGAVYVFGRSGGAWSQRAYVKASNTEVGDQFGQSLALAADGGTLAVGAYEEDSSATGVDGDQSDNAATASGAVYVYARNVGDWSQQAYVKASSTGSGWFGWSVALAADGNTLAVGAQVEDSGAVGIDGDSANHSAPGAGAVYVYSRSGGLWRRQAYVKASNTGQGDRFGYSVAFSADANTLVVGALLEDSGATGIDGDQAANSAADSGAVYVFRRSSGTWRQQAYVKASNAEGGDLFGWSVALAADGQVLAVGAPFEDGRSTGVGGDQADNAGADAGAVYLY